MRDFSCLVVLAAAVSLLAGCNAMNTPSSTSYADFTGNWQMTISDPPYPGPYPITSFTGSMASQGSNITAAFRVTGSGCVAATQDVTFSGSQAADGSVTLSSTNLPNNVATITSTTNGIVRITNGITPFIGSLAVTGSGPCTMGTIVLRGEEFAPLTGTFTGSIKSTSGVTSSFTITLAQASANSDGQFPESGTITVAGSGCTNIFSLAGILTGPTLTATLTPTSGPTATAVLSTGPPFGTSTPPLAFVMNISGTGCNAGAFSGNLVKQ